MIVRCFGAEHVAVPTLAVGERDRRKLHATLTGAFRAGVYEAAAADSMAAVGEVVDFLWGHIGPLPAGEADVAGDAVEAS